MAEPSIKELMQRCDKECENMGCRINEGPCDMQYIKGHLQRLLNLEKKVKEVRGFLCDEEESLILGILDCPHYEPLHYHHDGCPSCWSPDA